MEDKAKFKTYKGVCPVCRETMWICKSIAMEKDVNAVIGECPYCEAILYMSFNEENQEMDLKGFKEHWQSPCKEGEKNVKTDGKGSGIRKIRL